MQHHFPPERALRPSRGSCSHALSRAMCRQDCQARSPMQLGKTSFKGQPQTNCTLMKPKSCCRTSAIYPAMLRAVPKFAKALSPYHHSASHLVSTITTCTSNICVHTFLLLRSLTPFIVSSPDSLICVSDFRDSLLVKLYAFL